MQRVNSGGVDSIRALSFLAVQLESLSHHDEALALLHATHIQSENSLGLNHRLALLRRSHRKQAVSTLMQAVRCLEVGNFALLIDRNANVPTGLMHLADGYVQAGNM